MNSSRKFEALKDLGEAIRERRLQLGLSQEKLAEVADVHRNYIGKVERGEQNLTVMNLFRIADALHCNARDILDDALL